MRIIAGEFRGRKLLAPLGDTTRPITDRAKQSLFDTLGDLVAGAIVYDCFAGTGSMGLESLSRGAAHAVFFDLDRSALSLLRQNIDALKVQDRTTVLGVDLFKWARGAWTVPTTDLVFLDPPYRLLRERPDDLRSLTDALRTHMSTGATLVFRHSAADALPLAGFQPWDQRTYGDMVIELLRAGHDARAFFPVASK